MGCLREGEGGFEVVMVEEERRRRRKAEGPVWPMRQSFYPLFVKSASEYHDFRKSTSKTEIRDKNCLCVPRRFSRLQRELERREGVSRNGMLLSSVGSGS